MRQINRRKFKQKFNDMNGLPWWLEGKESACSAGDMGSIPESGRSPGEGNGYPLQYSCLENSMNGGAWGTIVLWGHKESDTPEQLTLSLFFTSYIRETQKN